MDLCIEFLQDLLELLLESKIKREKENSSFIYFEISNQYNKPFQNSQLYEEVLGHCSYIFYVVKINMNKIEALYARFCII